MARNRMSLDEAMEKYKGSGGSNAEYFSLKNDKDTAIVRFFHEDIDNDWYVVHKVKLNDKDRWVACTQEGDCPLCNSGSKPQLKLFLQLVEDGKLKLWERGQNFISKIQGQITRNGDLCNRRYEIERNGKKGDTSTTYELYALDKDNWTMNDIEDEFKVQRQELLGPTSFILQLDFSDMKKVANGTFKLEKKEDNDRGSRRSGRDEGRGRDRGRYDDEEDNRSSRRGRDDDDDDRGSRRRNDDDDRGSRRGRDEDEERGSRRSREDDEDRGSRRRNDDDEDRGRGRGREEREEREDRGEGRRRSGRGGSEIF